MGRYNDWHDLNDKGGGQIGAQCVVNGLKDYIEKRE